jgi:hypothetical protein
MNPIETIRDFINTSKFYCPIRHSNPLSPSESDDISDYMKDQLNDLTLEEIIAVVKDDKDIYDAIRKSVITYLCRREIMQVERKVIDAFEKRSEDPISYPTITFTPITHHSLTPNQIPDIISKVKNTIDITDVRLPQIINILDDTKFYLIDSFPDNIVEIYWFEVNEGPSFYINSADAITTDTSNTLPKNYCTICCKMDNDGYMFYSNIPNIDSPYTMIICKDFNKLCHHIPADYHLKYNYPTSSNDTLNCEFKTALELYNNMGVYEDEFNTVEAAPYINDNLPFQTDPKINMLYLIAKHCIQFSGPDNAETINSLIEWILNNTPLLSEIKAHPSYDNWMRAIELAHIPISDGMFVSRYHLFKYFNYRP